MYVFVFIKRAVRINARSFFMSVVVIKKEYRDDALLCRHKFI